MLMYKNFIITIVIICLATFNVKAETKIILFGDSLMAGYGLDQGDHLSIILETNLLKKGYNVKVINARVSGDTTAGGVNRINWT